MSKISQFSDLSNLKDQAFATFTSRVVRDIVNTVNGNLDFLSNFRCTFIEGTFVAGVELAITHDLGMVPTGKLVYYQTAADVVTDSVSNPATETTIYLLCASSGIAKMILF